MNLKWTKGRLQVRFHGQRSVVLWGTNPVAVVQVVCVVCVSGGAWQRCAVRRCLQENARKGKVTASSSSEDHLTRTWFSSFFHIPPDLCSVPWGASLSSNTPFTSWPHPPCRGFRSLRGPRLAGERPQYIHWVCARCFHLCYHCQLPVSPEICQKLAKHLICTDPWIFSLSQLLRQWRWSEESPHPH